MREIEREIGSQAREMPIKERRRTGVGNSTKGEG